MLGRGTKFLGQKHTEINVIQTSFIVKTIEGIILLNLSLVYFDKLLFS